MKTAGKKDGTEKVISARLVSLLTSDSYLETEDIIAVYKKRWAIESLFKQLKQRSTSGRFACKELLAALFLWGKCQRHQDNTDMGDAHRKSAADADAEVGQETMEFLGDGHHDQNPTHVLRGLPQFFENPKNEWQEILAKADESPPELELVF